ncbi:MAG: hypothetical protein NZ898_15315 [Myxococcota bacterium]|nr:hypothetical protein [Myxococcota bacterium]
MSALTSLLVRDRVVPVQKIEEAIQRQVVSGGDLETVLLELDAVPENVLAAYRAVLVGMLPATRDEVMRVARDVVRLVPREVAERHRLVPLSAEGRTLVVAVSAPLPRADHEQLSFLLGHELSYRLATDVRIAAALAHHYGVEPTQRQRRLLERLRTRDAGPVPFVRPPSSGRLDALQSAQIPSKAATGLQTDGADDVEQPRPPQPYGADGGPGAGDHARPRERVEPAARGSVVGVARVVGVGPDRSGAGSDTLTAAGPDGTREARTGTAPDGASSHRFRVWSPLPWQPRGPMSAKVAVERFTAATSPDEVLDVLLAFCRQYVHACALFTVAGEQAESRRFAVASGEATVPSVRVALGGHGAFARVRRTGQPAVVDLRDDGDAEVARTLGRSDAQPAVIVPVVLRGRVVVLIYGDLGGASFTTAEVPELLAIAPRAADAFGRLIAQRKAGYAAGGSVGSERAALKAAAGRVAASPLQLADPERAGRRDYGVGVGAAARWRRDGPLGVLGVPRSAPPPPAPPTGVAPAGGGGTPGGVPTSSDAQSSVASEDASPDAARGLSGGALGSTRPTDDADACAGPVRTTGASAGSRGARLSTSEPTEPSASVGFYALRDVARERVEPRPPRRSEPPAPRSPDPRRESGPPAGAVEHVGAATRLAPAPGTTAGRNERSSSPRATGSTDDAEAARRRVRTSAASVPVDAKVIVDMGDHIEALVDELVGCAPDDERRTVEALLQAGPAALPALAQRFPGPLWFDRHRPHRRLPRGKDVSAIARALHAFRDRAVPYVASLLTARDADVRFYATLLSADLPHRDLVAPVGERVFDDDAGVAALALDVLRAATAFPAELERVLEGLRAEARMQRRDGARRLVAVRALGELRDTAAVPLLVDLLDAEDAALARVARRSLVLLTRCDLGDGSKRWREWLERNGSRHRIEWLIDALLDDDYELRTAAIEELKALTQEYHGYHPGSPRRDREIAQRKYLRWWEQEGRRRFVEPR